jgi:hypothetical protein
MTSVVDAGLLRKYQIHAVTGTGVLRNHQITSVVDAGLLREYKFSSCSLCNYQITSS